jgi:hypothetical protein
MGMNTPEAHIARPKLQSGSGAWYTERGTTTEPSAIPGMEWIVRCGKRIALVPVRS